MKFFLVIILLLKYQTALSRFYEAEMDFADWKVTSDFIECKIEHKIPRFGNLYFTKESGKNLEVHFKKIFSDDINNLKVFSESPIWRSDLDIKSQIRNDNFLSASFHHRVAEKLLYELSIGNSPKIQWDISFDGELNEIQELSLSPINFQDAFNEYAECLDQQMPVSFSMISQSRIYFASNESSLSLDAKKWLDVLVKYIRKNPSVSGVKIDGHADATHNKNYNKSLSKMRVEAVRDYLTHHNISRDIIFINYHGENFPLADNSTSEGRSANRRVLIRISS